MKTKTRKQKPTNVPEAVDRLTLSQNKKARRDAFYKLHTDLSGSVKSMLKTLDTKAMEDILTAYVQMMGLKPDNEEKTVEIDIEIARQMAMFSALSLSRLVVEKYK